MYSSFTPNQSRVAVDLKQVYEAFQETSSQLSNYRGGMAWKKSSGKEYLIKVTNRSGGNKSLGPKTENTERIFNEFHEAKKRLFERHQALKSSMNELSGMAKAIGINRVPNIVCDTLRALEEKKLLGNNFVVIGTNAMYAYESAAGVKFDAGLLATMDLDFLWDARATLKLAQFGEEFEDKGFLSILQDVDKSFEISKNINFRAVNKNGFYVDLVKQTPNPPWKKGEPNKIAGKDLEPAWLENMHWLLSSEKFSSIVIGQDGRPATMVSPDPRAFAVYKMWMSQLATRDPQKKERDEQQAKASLILVKDRFPHLKLDENAERMFPKSIRLGF